MPTANKKLALLAALLWAVAAAGADSGERADERQETVAAFQLNPGTPAYEVWAVGRQQRAFADELLPGCFERTLALEELGSDQPLRWVFTGPRAGVTILIRTNEVRLAHRFYDSAGFGEIAGKNGRHPEWSAPEQAFAVTGGVRTLTLRLDGRLQLALDINGREAHRQEWIHDLSRHQIYLEGKGARVAGQWLRPAPFDAAVRVNPFERRQRMIGFGGIATPTAYARLSAEGKRRWWRWLLEYNLLIQREFPIGSRLHPAMDNWDVLADAAPHYYGDNFPNGETSDFDYNRRLQALGGQVWFEFWNLPPWAGTNVERYAQAVMNYCRTAQRRTGRPPAIVGVQNEIPQTPAQWQAMTLALRQALDAAGFREIKIQMADAGTLSAGIEFAKAFRGSAPAWGAIDFTATHMYDFQGFFTHPDDYDARLAEWHRLGDGKPFVSTELCVNASQYQTDSYRIALSMGQLYHKNLTVADAAAICYCWELLNVVQPSYGATRSLFVPDERDGFLPVPSSHQLRVFGAYSRRVRQGMTRLVAECTHEDLLAAAFSAGRGRGTLVILNRSFRPARVRVDWPGVRFTTLELADPYHQNAVQACSDRTDNVIVEPGAIVTLTNVRLKSG